MVNVTFHPVNGNIRVARGTTILEAARLAGVTIEAPCNGVATCGKCRVKIAPSLLGNIVSRGTHHLSREEQKAGYVLACGAEVIGDIAVEVPVQASARSLKIMSHGRKASVPLAPFVSKTYSHEEGITSVFAGGEVIGVEEGDTSQELYGIVVDIGTTTLVISLVSLIDGSERATASALNPQSLHAQDVLSRIRIASEAEGLESMRSGVIDAINLLTAQVAMKARVHQERIYEAVFSGNTCMLHLAVGISPESLGKHPYTPALMGGEYLEAESVGVAISPFGIVYLPPVISAYVGADIVSGLLATRLREEMGTVLFVDIGTNGEIAIARDGRMWATSTAAGPAFEGMNITFGMRAGEGAIERFSIDDAGDVEITTIGGSDAIGICGSGLMDIVAELARTGVIGSSGKFVSPEVRDVPEQLLERLVQREGKTVFMLTDRVWLTQKDIRQVQLAKGAIYAGILFLLRATGVSSASVSRVLIAGSFGYHLRAESLILIGLLPAEFSHKMEFIGNTSKSGGEAFLLNRECCRQMETIAAEVEVVELAQCQEFDRVFIASLGFSSVDAKAPEPANITR